MKHFLALVLAAAALAQPPGNTEHGKRLFEKDGCYECHGYMGQGGRDGPRIAATPLSLQALTRYVRRPLRSYARVYRKGSSGSGSDRHLRVPEIDSRRQARQGHSAAESVTRLTKPALSGCAGLQLQ